MKIKIFLTWLMLFASICIYADPPSWTVNSGSYSYNMTITGAISLNYIESIDTYDIVGAFIGDECVGVGSPIYISGADRYIVFLMVYSNELSATINFGVYDASENVIKNIPETIQFVSDGTAGSISLPYFWANPTLSSEAEMTEFIAPSQTGETIYDGTNISLKILPEVDINNLVASYVTSDHALVKVGTDVQESGVTVNNFTNPVEYFVRSADETNNQTYTISITYAPGDIFLNTENIDETEPLGTTVGELTTDDPDNTNFIYSFVSGEGDDDNDLFTINDDTLKINTELNYEEKTSYNIRIKTDDGNNGLFEKEFIILVNDVNDEIPVVTSAEITLPENNELVAVHQLVASDNDTNPDFGILEYLIVSGNEENKFSINTETGEVSLIANLDFETTEQYVIGFNVSDGINTGTGTLTINITDINDEIPIVTGDYENILETTLPGEQIHVIVASDADAGSVLSYSITNGNIDNVFSINPNNGSVTVGSALDYETTQVYNLEISVSDQVNTGNGILTINLVDVNDETPQLTNTSVNIDETSEPGTEVHTVVATDEDANSEFNYSIISGNINNTFSINPGNGAITTINDLDYEDITFYSLGINVSDGTNIGNGIITVIINDENDEIPIADNATISISESAFTATDVHTVMASDNDEGTIFTYLITDGNEAEKFSINENTGLIKLEGELDFENTQIYTLEVSVSDNDEIHTVTCEIIINVVDENDETPQVTDAVLNLNETTVLNTHFHTVIADDIDLNSELEYIIASGNNGTAFTINSVNGSIETNSELDYETTQQYILQINVSDGVNIGTGTITINITDENDETPQITSASINLPEDSDLGFINNIVVTDADINEAFRILQYSITSGNDENKFEINTETGDVSLIEALDFETTQQYVLQINVSDNINIGTGTLTINVTEINDEIPVVTPATENILESKLPGEQVIQVIASDGDAGTVLSYSITAGNINDAFVISSSGMIIVNSPLDFETTETYSIEISAFDGLFTGSEIITINIVNINDEVPLVANASVSINETVEFETDIHTVEATDADEGSVFIYEIISGNTNNVFDINSNSGLIQTIGVLDYEDITFYSLNVSVSDGVNTGTGTISISINDENDEIPVAVDATVDISESAFLYSDVHTVEATDADAGTVFNYSIIAGNEAEKFSINENSGLIKVVGELDFENNQAYMITVLVNDNDNIHSANCEITININDENDETPQVTGADFDISETTELGTHIHTVIVVDADANSNFTYTISSGNIGNAFAINPDNGAITVNSTLDYETLTIYNLQIDVSDGVNIGTGTVTINITDENDELPYIVGTSANVDETAITGTNVHTVEATDGDANSVFTYSIISGNTNNTFYINPSSGVIQTINNLDYEDIIFYSLGVEVNDGINTGNGIIMISVNDENDEIPVVISQDVEILEDVEVGFSVVYVEASDADAGSVFSFFIESGNGQNKFEINETTGEITVIENLNYEEDSYYDLVIRVNDAVHNAFGTIHIDVTAINDEPPVVTDATIALSEDAIVNQVVHTVIAEDPDNSILTYSITDGNIGSVFAIDPDHGIITVIGTLDYETLLSYELEITVDDGLFQTLGAININLLNVNDESPIVTEVVISADENLASGLVITGITVSDPDGASNFQYSIIAGNAGNVFNIEPNMGIITLNGTFDYEFISSYQLIVSVSDGINIGNGTITVNINDVNDEIPVVNSGFTYCLENLGIEQTVFSVIANDADASSVLVYSITGGNSEGKFSINSETGVITVAAALDYEKITSYTLQISVSDNINTGSENIVIEITDVNDEKPIIQDENISIDENETIGYIVHQVQVEDEDADSEFTFSITDGNDENKFEIDEYSGEIKLIELLSFKTVKEYNLEISVSDGVNLSIGNIYLNVTGEAVDDPTYFPANNTFSPNDDGINDFWEIENSELYENCDFYIYDHLQNIIYQSKGYNNDWNGKYKGKELPMGTYYYYVVCQDCGDCKYSGAISIIR